MGELGKDWLRWVGVTVPVTGVGWGNYLLCDLGRGSEKGGTVRGGVLRSRDRSAAERV